MNFVWSLCLGLWFQVAVKHLVLLCDSLVWKMHFVLLLSTRLSRHHFNEFTLQK